MKLDEVYRTLIVKCDCGHLEHNVKFQYWNDEEDWSERGAGIVWVTSVMRIQNVWRRFKAAAQLIVWGEVSSGLDVLWDIDEIQKLNHFVGFVLAEMRSKERKWIDGQRREEGL